MVAGVGILIARGAIANAMARTIIGDGVTVDHVHILFERHRVVCSQGLETEGFRPGPRIASRFEAGSVAGIYALFARLCPQMCPQAGAGDSPAARRMLKGCEARVLSPEWAA